ncbi:hypothetical protein M9H77_12709 [Catharanthus roseus]|uniref:Uncharacterized protein n=2 Tax=Catharanthus roseus TaxID=4058 RepID=A0ACC0BIB2_CATRO|nr:hypothetical protein M9H77_12707 [Catharanthus roseus]KAI5672345.1 hypothetical protein M9H77_12709 [Catharanthus roseus]
MHKIIEDFMVKMTELLEASMFQSPEFYGEVEQEIKAELFLEQLNDIYDTLKYEDAMRVTSHWPSCTPYKRPGQGPWKLGNSKRPRIDQRT